MANESTDGQTEEQEKEAKLVEAAKAAELEEASKEQTVKYSTYDKAMNTAAKRGQEIDDLKAKLAEAQKVTLENTKNTDTGKYVETLESSNELLKQQFAELQSQFKETIEIRDKQDVDRTKLSAVWDAARKQGMVDDRDLLNFIDKDIIQLDENGVVNIKSVNTEVNRLKTSKPFFFQEPKPDKINERAPSGDDEIDNKELTFSQQLARKQS